MPIKFSCPRCKERVKVSRKEAGTERPCPECGKAIKVPPLKSAPDVEEWDENSDRPETPPTPPPASAPRTLDDLTFVAVAKKLGFPDEAMLARFRALREERGQDGEKMPLHALLRASGALSAHQEQLIETAAAMAAGAAAASDGAAAPPSPAAPSPFSKPIPSARAAAKRLRSNGPVPAAQAPRRNRKLAVALVTGVSLGAFALVAILVLTRTPKPPPPPDPAVDPAVTPVTPRPVVAVEKKVDPAVEAALEVAAEALSLEKAGKEVDSEAALERALETSREPEARRSLVAARRRLLDRCREKLESVVEATRKAALAGDIPEAQRLLAEYVPHMPTALWTELEREIKKLNDELIARAPKGAPKPVNVRHTPAPAQPVARSDEPARYSRLEVALDDALRRLDDDVLAHAIDQAGSFQDPQRAAQVAFWRECCQGVLAVVQAALPALEKQAGTTLDLALWKGARASGKLAKVDGHLLLLAMPGGGERVVDFAELSEKTLSLLLRAQASDERVQFGVGILAYVHEDYVAALDKLRRAPSIPGALPLAKMLEERGVGSAATPATPDATKPDTTKPTVAKQDDGTERWPNGKPKRVCKRDSKGRLTGACTEYYEDGKTRVRSNYEQGELSGEYVSYHPNGKVARKAYYKKGKLSGECVDLDEKGKVLAREVYLDERLLYSRTREEIVAELAAIEAAPVRAPSRPASTTAFPPLDWEQQAKALRRLRGYRYLCGVASDVDLSWEYAEKCTAASKLLTYVGHLEHEPKKPALCPDELYKEGFFGTSHSNLHSNSGGTNAVESVDSYMYDSDESNVDRVGHRRWCLNPTMLRTAFGVEKEYTAMYSLDQGRKAKTPDRVAYPAPGWFPASFARHDRELPLAWSVALDPNHYRWSKGELVVTVRPADETYRKGEPVLVTDARVDEQNFGTAPCVIFRPKCSLAAGQRYWVDVKGFTDKSGADVAIEYFVEFFDR